MPPPEIQTARIAKAVGTHHDRRHDCLYVKFRFFNDQCETIAIPGRFVREAQPVIAGWETGSREDVAALALVPLPVTKADRKAAPMLTSVAIDGFPNGIILTADFPDQTSRQFAPGYDLALKLANAMLQFGGSSKPH